jgi:anti-anti-sigma factor
LARPAATAIRGGGVSIMSAQSPSAVADGVSRPTSTTPARSNHRPAVEAELPPELGSRDRKPPAALAVRLDRPARCIRVRGELDMATVPVLGQVVAMLLDLDPGDSTIELSGVTFIDAAGLGALVMYAAQFAAVGAKISVVGVTPRVHRVFDIVGLAGLLEASSPPSGRQ